MPVQVRQRQPFDYGQLGRVIASSYLQAQRQRQEQQLQQQQLQQMAPYREAMTEYYKSRLPNLLAGYKKPEEVPSSLGGQPLKNLKQDETTGRWFPTYGPPTNIYGSGLFGGMVGDVLNAGQGGGQTVVGNEPSEEDIAYTMKQHNLSRAEVLTRLGR